jgi:hypothetical protein
VTIAGGEFFQSGIYPITSSIFSTIFAICVANLNYSDFPWRVSITFCCFMPFVPTNRVLIPSDAFPVFNGRICDGRRSMAVPQEEVVEVMAKRLRELGELHVDEKRAFRAKDDQEETFRPYSKPSGVILQRSDRW